MTGTATSQELFDLPQMELEVAWPPRKGSWEEIAVTWHEQVTAAFRARVGSNAHISAKSRKRVAANTRGRRAKALAGLG